jgi:hypothetical protein
MTTSRFLKGLILLGVFTAAAWALATDTAEARRCSAWHYSGNSSAFSKRCPGGVAWYRVYTRYCNVHRYGSQTQVKRVWAGCARR